MGAGRKTRTFTVSEVPQQYSAVNGGMSARNLRKDDLGGVIFGCKHGTHKECLEKQLFGLPAPHYAYVRNIDPGLPLFLFNYTDRKLHGIFEAASEGQLSIDPYAWLVDGLATTPFAAQVRVRIRKQCHPLLEDQFRPVIAKNYNEKNCFYFELDRAQTKKLIGLFRPAPAASNPSTVRGKHPENRVTSIKVSAPVQYRDGNDGSSTSCQSEDDKLLHPITGPGSSRSIACSGLSYSSVVKSSSACDAQPLTVGCSLDAEKSGGGRSMSVLGPLTKLDTSMITSDAFLAQKKWTALFKDDSGCDKGGIGSGMNKNVEETASDAINCIEDLKGPALETCSDHLDECTMHNDSQSLSHSPNGFRQDMNGACQYMEVAGECDDFSFKEFGEDLYSSLVTEDGTSVANCTQLFHAMQSVPSIEYSTRAVCEPNSNGSENNNREGHSSPRLPDLREMQVDIINTEGISMQPVSCTLHAAVLSDINSSGIHSILDKDGVLFKLLSEVLELKSSHLQQAERISSLEKELGESRLELQQLKDQYKKKDVEKELCLVGGFNGHSWSTSLELYSPTLDRLETVGPLNCIRSYCGLANLNSELFLLGGFSGDMWHNAVESYNPVYNRWLSHPPLYRRKGNLAAVSSGGKIFAIGGGNGVECFPDVETFDPCAATWISAQPLAQKRFSPAAAEFNGVLYVAGGFDGKFYLKSVERLDPRERSWKSLESMCTNRACHSLVVLNEKLYAIGGYDGVQMIPTVEVYDPRVGFWMSGRPMNNSRGYFGTVVIGDRIHVIGGLKDDTEILDTVEYYTEGNEWQETTWSAIGKRSFLSAVVL